MDDPHTKRGGVDGVDAVPPWTATGDRGIRVTRVAKRHRKLLDSLQEDLGEGCGRREGIAALLEYYHRYPDRVVDEIGRDQFR